MRILAIFSLSLSAAVFAANYLLPASALLPLALCFLLSGALLLLFRRKWLRGIELVLFGLAVGLSVFLIKYKTVTVPCHKLDGQSLTFRACLLDYPDVYEDYCRAEVKVSDENLPAVNALLYVNDLSLKDVGPGQILEISGKLRTADRRYGKEYDRYNAKNIFLTVNAGSAVSTGETKLSVPALSSGIRRTLGEQADRFYKPREAAFMKALLLGDKSALYEETELYNALSDAGIMHVAAVSGMHIAFLVSLLGFAFGRGKVGVTVSVIIIWAFVFITGASPSAVRAGFMQSLLLLAPVFRRENDPLTSLSTVLALVLIENPYAAASLSLQLSFGAMAGIMCFSGKIYRALSSGLNDCVKKILNYPIAVISSSLAVMVFTLPLTVLYFGCVPVLAPIVNVLTMWAVSFCFCAGFAGLLLSFVIPPMGVVFVWAASAAEKVIFAVVLALTKLPFSTVYLTDKAMTVWLLASLAVVLVFLLSKLSGKAKLIASVVSVLLLLFTANAAAALSYSMDKCCFSVMDVGQGQSIAIMSGDDTIVIDCGGGAKDRGAGQIASAVLLSRGRRKISALVLTHLHSDHVNGVTDLMEKTKVEKAILPENVDDDEKFLTEITESAKRHGSEIVLIDSDREMSFGNIGLTLFAPGEKGGANERCLMCRVGAFDKDMLITADAPISAEKELVERAELKGIEYMIAGHHGSRTSSGGELLKAVSGKTAIISVGYNTYGHPSEETLARLTAYGYNILRTDLNGTVEIRVR